MTRDNDIPPEVQKDIMKATFRAITRYGYADLTMEKIAEESNKCKSTIHYHYGTKENLMVDFIKYLQKGFKRNIVPDTGDPLERLNGVIDRMLFGTKNGKIPERFHTALLELRSQAPYNEKYRRQITENDELIHGKVKGIIEDGIEKGVFEKEDPGTIATIILSAVDGARARQISTERKAVEKARNSLDDIIDEMLLKGR
ncbi:MAG: TetR/AcrR family transcriptional regulator [Candidatus Saliniplasma sp.]